MSKRFPSVWLNELLNKCDIVELVSSYTSLKQNGSSYKGLCPFHSEKTPSFNVDPDKNLYYCFGCHAGGSIVNFVMEMEKMTYPEAIEELARRFSVPLPSTSFTVDDNLFEEKRNRYFSANEEAAKYYHNLLYSNEGKPSLEYFKNRGLTESSIKRFGLGASGKSWTGLTDYLLGKNFSLDELAAAGLTSIKDKGYFDVFRNRAIFPIISKEKKVLGFGGRAIDNSMPKYLNTAESPIFNKRLGVFAANMLRNERHLKRIILTEGYMDVISLYQAGITGVVATLGTALTIEQARLLKRYAPEIWVCYDGDEAGQSAIEKAIGIFVSENVPCKVIKLEKGMDPDDFIKINGSAAFNEITPMMYREFLIERLEMNYRLNNSSEIIEFLREASEIVKTADPVEQEHLTRLLSSKTGYDETTIQKQMSILPNIKIKNKKSANITVLDSIPADEHAELTLISLIAQSSVDKNLFSDDYFSSKMRNDILKALKEGIPLADIIANIVDSDERALYAKIMSENYKNIDTKKLLNDCIATINKSRLRKKIDTLTDKLSSSDVENTKSILKEIQDLSIQLSNFN